MQWGFSVVLFLTVVYSGDTSSPRVIDSNVIVLELNGNPMEQQNQVSLYCGDQFEETEIHWQKNGQNIPAKGNNVSVIIEAMLGGNFTCHGPAGDVLNHTLVLISPLGFEKIILTKKHNGEFITCLARNYSSTFHCSWKWNPTRNGVVVLFKAFRQLNMINCTLDSDGMGLTCEDLQCPFSEEVTRINLTLLVRNQYRLEEHQKEFFIRDIIKPDRLSITKIKNDEFEWQVPPTWNTPASFFPLQYEVMVLSHRKDCNAPITDHSKNHEKIHLTNNAIYKVSSKKSYTFCVRAQDYISNLVWSEWTQHRVIKHRSRK